MANNHSETNLYEMLQPFFAYFWVVVLIFVVGIATVVGVSYTTPPRYISKALIVVDGKYLPPEAVARIITTRAAADTTIDTHIAPGGIIEVKAISQYRASVVTFLMQVVEDAQARATALIPDYATQKQEVLGYIQDIIGLMNTTDDPIQLPLLSIELPGLVNRFHALAELENSRETFFQVVTEPTIAESYGARVEWQHLLCMAVISLGIGCTTAYLLSARDQARAKKGDS